LHPSPNVTKFIVDGCLERNPKSTELPVYSLVFEEICRFWAEFDDFGMEFGKTPVILPVSCFA
jgi:hypothetical protein